MKYFKVLLRLPGALLAVLAMFWLGRNKVNLLDAMTEGAVAAVPMAGHRHIIGTRKPISLPGTFRQNQTWRWN
jgi:hypothetical protein